MKLTRLTLFSTLVNIVMFNLIWLAIVSSTVAGIDQYGLFVAVIWAAVHLSLSPLRREDTRVLIAAVLGGPLVDSLLVQLGLIEFRGFTPIEGMAPGWIVALWINFALVLNHSLQWMRGRWLLATVAGAALAPLTYWSGTKMGAATLAEPIWQPLGALGLAWAIIFPALLMLTVKDREAALAQTSAQPQAST